MDDPVILPILEAIHACMCAELDDNLCLCYVSHGSGDMPAIPSIGRGVAWVGVSRIFPASGFGVEPEVGQSCSTGLNAELVLGVVRCYAVTKDNPNPDQSLEYARQMLSDMNALRRAVLCCDAIEDRELGEWTPLGPEGGLYGGSWNLTVG